MRWVSCGSWSLSVLHPTPINLCIQQGCAFSDGKWVAALKAFYFPALRFPLPILFSCLPPYCGASPQNRGGWGEGAVDGEGRGAARGAVPSRPRPVPAAAGAVPSAPAGRRPLARRLIDVLLIREMPEQNTRCEQRLNAVCPELAPWWCGMRVCSFSVF